MDQAALMEIFIGFETLLCRNVTNAFLRPFVELEIESPLHCAILVLARVQNAIKGIKKIDHDPKFEC